MDSPQYPEQLQPLYIDRNTESPEIVDVEEGIKTVLQLSSEAIASYRAFMFSGAGLVNQSLSQVQAMALQNFIITEFCKLVQRSNNPNEADSSLYKLNELLRKKYPEWSSTFNQNSKLLKQIVEDPFYNEKILILRNKCYAHSVKHPENTKMGYRYFTYVEFTEFMRLFEAAIQILQHTYKIYDRDMFDFSPYYDDDRPLNFLLNYKQYQDFYIKHFLKFKDEL